MAQRAGAAGGSLDIYSNAGEGTETTLRLPFKLKKAWWRRAGKQ
jgi:chemotaxis protein histidine kinase CheA